jgi:NAD(P)H dehydrogenase (quinone)
LGRAARSFGESASRLSRVKQHYDPCNVSKPPILLAPERLGTGTSMLAVTGATGKVGGAVAGTLLSMRQAVRVVVRDPAKGEGWMKRGCEVAIASTTDADALASAFAGVEGAFVMLPPLFDPSPGFPEAREMVAALRGALHWANPAKIVVLSTIGANTPQPNLLNQLGLMEKAFADLSMPVCFLRPAWFMENAAGDVPSAAQSGVIHSYLVPLDKPFPMVSTEDVGRAAAGLLMENWNGHRVVELEGPKRVSANDLASAFAKALRRPVKARVVLAQDWDALFSQQGMINPLPRMQMLDGFNNGWIDFEGDEALRRHGAIGIDEAIAALISSRQGDSK